MLKNEQSQLKKNNRKPGFYGSGSAISLMAFIFLDRVQFLPFSGLFFQIFILELLIVFFLAFSPTTDKVLFVSSKKNYIKLQRVVAKK